MQRQAIWPACAALRNTCRPVIQATPGAYPLYGANIAHIAPLSGPSRLPHRAFTTTIPALKKAKTSPAKPAKGKVRSQDDMSETDVDVEGVMEKTREKMEKAVGWAKGVVYDGVERGRGRVSPAILDTVRVQLPDHPSAATLNSIASITVKQNTLFIEVWDPAGMKHVESALHKANMPGLSPQKVDQSTIKIPVSRPTMEQRTQILKNLNATVEGAKQQVRTARADGLKLVGGKTAQGADDVQDLANEYGKQLDDLLGQAKKEFEK